MGFELSIHIPHYTYKDYELWEGDWELIKGLPNAMSPAPNWMHQNFGATFISEFIRSIENNKNASDCKVIYSCDWIINDDTIVRM